MGPYGAAIPVGYKAALHDMFAFWLDLVVCSGKALSSKWLRERICCIIAFQSVSQCDINTWKLEAGVEA